MKKTFLMLSLMLAGALLFNGTNAFAQKPVRLLKPAKIAQNEVFKGDNILKKLAQKDPAKVALLLLEQNQLQYVHNPDVVYIGVKGEEEVLVICKVADSDVGDFFHVVHKKANRLNKREEVSLPSVKGFTTLYQAEK